MRGRYQDLSASYNAMKDLYPNTRQPADRYASQVHNLRTKYLRLVESLQKDLKLDVPPQILALLKASASDGQSQTIVAQVVPARVQSHVLRSRGRLSQRRAAGTRPTPAQSARERMQNLRDRARGRTRGNN